MAYNHKYRAEAESFPNAIPEIFEYKDVDSTVAATIATIEQMIASGNFTEASDAIDKYEKSVSNPSKSLAHYLLSAADINRILEDIYNTQIYAAKQKQEIYIQNAEPSDADVGDVWIGGA